MNQRSRTNSPKIFIGVNLNPNLTHEIELWTNIVSAND